MHTFHHMTDLHDSRLAPFNGGKKIVWITASTELLIFFVLFDSEGGGWSPLNTSISMAAGVNLDGMVGLIFLYVIFAIDFFFQSSDSLLVAVQKTIKTNTQDRSRL